MLRSSCYYFGSESVSCQHSWFLWGFKNWYEGSIYNFTDIVPTVMMLILYSSQENKIQKVSLILVFKAKSKSLLPQWRFEMKKKILLLLLLSRFSRVRLCATPWTAAYQASPSLGFSRQEHWSGLPFPSPMHESGKWKWSRSVVSDS